MSLRDDCIEALKPYMDVDPAIDPHEWGLAQRHLAGAALDALLDCLTQHADEQKRQLAWLMWCFDQGYRNPRDRAIMEPWITADEPETAEDRVTRFQLLLMADEIWAGLVSALRETP